MDNDGAHATHTRRRSSTFTQLPANDGKSRVTSAGGHEWTLPPQIPEAEDNSPVVATQDSHGESSVSSDSEWEMDDMDPEAGLEDDEETGLTRGDRRKRTKRKRMNTRMDERVVGEDTITKEEKQMAKQSFIKAALYNGTLIGLWYCFSISISVYNKWMFSKENLDFHFPLFTTSLHMLVQFTLASLVLFLIPSLRPSLDTPQQYAQLAQSQHQPPTEPPPRKPVMTKWFYLTRISPCGLATGLDIGLGNMSLKFISLTFYTMCKSSVLAFVLLFAFMFRLETPSWRLGGIILLMTIGVVMMVAGETAFNVLGFALILSAAFFSGLRWSLTQILLLRNPATSNPFSSIFFLAPIMCLSLIVIALPIEGPADIAAGFRALGEAKGIPLSIAILIFPGVLAFLMTASEFALLKRTSVVTLSVCGIFKEVLTISVAGAVFGDKLTPINISGLVVTIASIAAYNYIKVRKMQEVAIKEAHALANAAEPRQNVAARHSVAADDQQWRQSTGALIRSSLSMPVTASGDRVASWQDAGDRERSSPLKRPEDLE